MRQLTHAAKPQFEFRVEPCANKVRLIILKDGTELACRKEYINQIQKFIEEQQETIFKGRLQLMKGKNAIDLLFKKEKVLSIKTSKLLAMLDDANTMIKTSK